MSDQDLVDFPEHNKLQKVATKLDGIFEWLEYSYSKDYDVVVVYEMGSHEWVQCGFVRNLKDKAYEMYGIDPKKLSEEKERMLEMIKNHQEQGDEQDEEV